MKINNEDYRQGFKDGFQAGLDMFEKAIEIKNNRKWCDYCGMYWNKNDNNCAANDMKTCPMYSKDPI